MADITLYTNPNSRGQIAHWMLEELGQPYDTVWLPFGPDGHKGEAYLALNPMGKIPTVVHGESVVTECAAICVYLAEAFPQAELGPTPAERADYYRWTFFGAGPLEQAVTSKAMQWAIPEGKQGTVGFGSFEDTVGTLEGLLATRPYVCGARFTAADVYVGAQVSWGLAFGTLEKRPAFEAYAARLRERPASQRVAKLNDAKRAEG